MLKIKVCRHHIAIKGVGASCVEFRRQKGIILSIKKEKIIWYPLTRQKGVFGLAHILHITIFSKHAKYNLERSRLH